MHSGYNFVKNGTDKVAANPLLDLLTRYDGTHVEIGMIRFSKPSAHSDNKWVIGKDEADLLILDLNTQRIFVEEVGTDGYVLSQCAENADRFLTAILPAACFLARCTCEDGLYEDQDAARSQAQDCAEKAGGPEYFNFYATLVGYEGDIP